MEDGYSDDKDVFTSEPYNKMSSPLAKEESTMTSCCSGSTCLTTTDETEEILRTTNTSSATGSTTKLFSDTVSKESSPIIATAHNHYKNESSTPSADTDSFPLRADTGSSPQRVDSSPQRVDSSPQRASKKKTSRGLESRHTLIHREARPSRLDSCDPDSKISQSEFKGLLNLCHMAGALWLIANPLYCRFEKGYWIDPDLAYAVFKDTEILMAAWMVCFLWAFTSFGIFKWRQAGLPRAFVHLFMHANQAILVLGMFALIRYKDWAVFPSTFALVVTFLHYMKMHTYVASTLDFENDPEALKKGFPNKCTLGNFVRFLLIPTLVYEIDYPKSKHSFRPWYFAHKTLNMVITMGAIFLVASSVIIPVFEKAHETLFIYTFAKMIVPLLVMDFLFFYMMFENILNMLAEITNYGDREFYEDWWNCTTWEEFARKWNRPVHEFLLCHVYIKAYQASKRSRFLASLATFVFSAILHETFLTVCLGFIGYWMFLLMLVQIPLIMLSRFHKNTTWGNYYIWLGLCLGVPFLTVLYGRRWAARLRAAAPIISHQKELNHNMAGQGIWWSHSLYSSEL